jgi:hypothetical protein
MENVRSFDEAELEILSEAEHALKTVRETTQVATRPIIGINYPYFIVFGIAVLISHISGQFLPPTVSAITAGWGWFIFAPICQFIAYNWYRAESKRYGVLKNEKRDNYYLLVQFSVFCLIGFAITILLVANQKYVYIFPMWSLITSGIYILWGRRVSKMLVGLGIVNLFISFGVIIWLIEYSFLVLALSVGGGNLLLGVIAWRQLQNHKNRRQLGFR